MIVFSYLLYIFVAYRYFHFNKRERERESGAFISLHGERATGRDFVLVNGSKGSVSGYRDMHLRSLRSGEYKKLFVIECY